MQNFFAFDASYKMQFKEAWKYCIRTGSSHYWWSPLSLTQLVAFQWKTQNNSFVCLFYKQIFQGGIRLAQIPPNMELQHLKPTYTNSDPLCLPNLLGAQIHQALPSSAWKLPRQLIYSYMLSRANWAHSQKGLERVSHSPSLLSYSQPHNAILSLVLAVMLTGPLLWQFNSLRSIKSSTSLLGFFSATSVSWISSQRGLSPTASPRQVVGPRRSGSGTAFLVALLSHEAGCSIASPCS